MKPIARDATWVILALGTIGRRRKPRLTEVIAAADAINHDIMSYEEFVRGVGLLLSADLVEPPAGLRLTRRGRDLLKEHGSGRWHERWPAIEAHLEELSDGRRAPTTVASDSWADAVAEYVES